MGWRRRRQSSRGAWRGNTRCSGSRGLLGACLRSVGPILVGEDVSDDATCLWRSRGLVGCECGFEHCRRRKWRVMPHRLLSSSTLSFRVWRSLRGNLPSPKTPSLHYKTSMQTSILARSADITRCLLRGGATDPARAPPFQRRLRRQGVRLFGCPRDRCGGRTGRGERFRGGRDVGARAK